MKNTTDDEYNESIVSMLSLSGIVVSLILDLLVQKLLIIMTTTSTRHNNVMRFLEVSKKVSSDLTRVLHVLVKVILILL